VISCDAEKGVEELYRRIQLPPLWVDKLRHEMRQEVAERQSEAVELRVVLTKRLTTLADERQKLLRAYYANAIPLELLKADQDRITGKNPLPRRSWPGQNRI
jgi:site-specific DNA recombinase